MISGVSKKHTKFEFKTPTKTPRKRSIRKDENSPFPFSPTDSDFEISSNQKKDINPLANRDNDLKSPVPVIPIYDQNSTAGKLPASFWAV